MTTHKGAVLITALMVVLGLLIIGGGTYVVMNPKAAEAPAAEENVQTETNDIEAARKEKGWIELDSSTTIAFKLEGLGEDAYGKPSTKVSAVIDGKTYLVGTYDGNCSEIKETGGTINLGVDGGGLLAGELAAVQCWWGGGGNEIGVFAHEDGGYQIMVGDLDEGSADTSGLRGNFRIKTDISL